MRGCNVYIYDKTKKDKDTLCLKTNSSQIMYELKAISIDKWSDKEGPIHKNAIQLRKSIKSS